jgi:ABC-type uncharacterized transport system substrate-binding protein
MPLPQLRYQSSLVGLLVGLTLFLHLMNPVEGSDGFQTKPTTHKGKKWKIGYYEGGRYLNYPTNLRAIAEGLVQLGWMEKTTIADTDDPTDSKSVWEALSNVKSAYLQFERQAYYCAYWDKTLRASNKKAALTSLQNGQLDLIIAMGTWAGQDLANDQHSVPVIVVSSSDPIKSGIIKSASYSGFDHVHARCDPNRYRRQVRLFHSIVGFKYLGIAYEDTQVGRSYAAIEDVESMAARHGFKIVKCDAKWTGVTQQEYARNLVECHKKLAPQVEAVYITVHAGMDSKHMKKIMAPLIAHNLPTFSQRGSQHVKNGALMSIARAKFGPIGMFHASIIAKIFNGAHPGELNQIFEDPRNIAINLNTAKAIGFKPPKGLMMVADEIYE